MKETGDLRSGGGLQSPRAAGLVDHGPTCGRELVAKGIGRLEVLACSRRRATFRDGDDVR
jgi:hypothetical protein